MIFILSEENDIATNHVIEWLIYLEASFIRINKEDCISVKEISFDGNQHTIKLVKNNDTILSISEISACWFRRGRIRIQQEYLSSDEIKDKKLLNGINAHLYDEILCVEQFIYTALEKKPHINKVKDFFDNKLNTL